MLRRRQVYLLSAPEAIGQVLVANAANYTSRELNLPATAFLGNGLLSLDGEDHRRQRALVQPAFGRRRVEAYTPGMLDPIQQLASDWSDVDVVEVHAAMQRLTLAIVARAIFDVDLQEQGAALGAAFGVLLADRRRGLIATTRLLVTGSLPDPPGLRQAQAALDGWMRQLLARRRAEASDRGDIVSALLQAQGEGPPLTDDQIRDHAMTLLAAGHETTSNALTVTLHLLSGHPTERARLQAELDAGLAGSPPSAADLERLPFLDAVLREALRLYPPVWVVGRRARNADLVAGFHLPAGSFCLMSQWVMHRTPAFWPDPARFRPERWLPPARPPAPFTYFPFGAGPRTCIGMPFALLEARLALAVLLQRFTPEALPGQRLRLSPVVTLRPRGGVRVRLRARRPGG